MSFIDGFSDFALRGEVSDRVRSAAEQAAAGVGGHSCQWGGVRGRNPQKIFRFLVLFSSKSLSYFENFGLI